MAAEKNPQMLTLADRRYLAGIVDMIWLGPAEDRLTSAKVGRRSAEVGQGRLMSAEVGQGLPRLSSIFMFVDRKIGLIPFCPINEFMCSVILQ